MERNPYLQVVGEPRQMAGKGAPRSTVFGVLGRTKMDEKMRSLGGLVAYAKPSAAKPPTVKESAAENTERRILGKASKTRVPGAHYGMVPYAGQFMSLLGPKL